MKLGIVFTMMEHLQCNLKRLEMDFLRKKCLKKQSNVMKWE